MPRFPGVALVCTALGVLVVACSAQGDAQNSTATPTIPLLAYQTLTATATTASDESSQLPQTSPTPHIYLIVEGDTLISIADHFGISLDALMAANPSADARLLSPGAELLIPTIGADGTAVSALPTPTPVPVDLDAVDCYSTAAGELWCFLLARNDSGQAVENLAGVVHLRSATGEVLASLEAAAPLNILLVGEAMPLVAYSDDPPNGWADVSGVLLRAYALPENDGTYLSAELLETDIDISESGLAARVLGNVSVSGGQAETIWVLAIAFDKDGAVVGVRRWESAGENEFYFWVYSLGPEIAEIQVLVEARP